MAPPVMRQVGGLVGVAPVVPVGPEPAGFVMAQSRRNPTSHPGAKFSCKNHEKPAFCRWQERLRSLKTF